MKPGFVARAGQALERFARGDSGDALIELAFAVPILVMLAVGAFDFGMAFQQKHNLAAAAQSGAQMAVQDRSTQTMQNIPFSDIITRVREEAGDTTEPYAITFDTDSGYYCLCNGQTTRVDCSAVPGDVCPAGNVRPLEGYVEITLARDFKLIFPYPGVPDDSVTLQTSTTMRLF